MKHRFLTLFALLACSAAYAQLPPIITAWKINTTGATGYNNIAANVQSVQYSTNNVYVSCTDVPDYSIGPWGMNPNVASNQNFVYKFTRNPQKNNGTLTAIGLGHTGALLNGVSIFNCDDGMTYNNDGVWHRNAYVFEGQSLDACGGHPQQDGEYHNHYNPSCVYDIYDSTHHSPLLGFMFDGYPVYGIYAYSDTDGTGPIRIMQSSYQLRNITDRTTLPDGSTASATGPAISSTYPLGSFLQDYVYVAGSGDLDEHNGRWCVTPEYPNGTYAYFFSVDATLTPTFPYTPYSSYYGVVQQGNSGPNSGHNTISEQTTTYTPTTAIAGIDNQTRFNVFPNPTADKATVYISQANGNNMNASLYNMQGQLLQNFTNIQGGVNYTIDLSPYPAGTYMLRLETNSQNIVRPVVKE